MIKNICIFFIIILSISCGVDQSIEWRDDLSISTKNVDNTNLNLSFSIAGEIYDITCENNSSITKYIRDGQIYVNIMREMNTNCIEIKVYRK